MVVEDVPTVPLDSMQQKRMRNFLPPLILLESIHLSCNQRVDHKASDAPQNPNHGPEGRFRTFVNKLAHICDYRPKGDTVTALAVLLVDNGRVLYLFASNNRKHPNLNKTRAEITSILNILKENLEAKIKQSDSALNGRLLRQVLILNTVRLQGYLTSLSKTLKICIEQCESDAVSGDSKSAARALNKLLQMIPETSQAGQKSNEFVACSIRCIQTIQEYRQLPLQSFIDKRVYTSERMRTASCWSTLQHVMGRLLSYQYDVETLISAHHIWGDTDLFRDFEVDFLPSSGSYPADAVRLNAESAEAIINRAPGMNEAQRITLKQHALDLQLYNLDAKLAEQWERKIDPVVHAEILVHDWLLRTPGGIRSHRFFGNWSYIGTSKPICRLCQYYFDVIATPVRFRDSHPNMYLNWRPPDVRVVDGEDVEQAKDRWRLVIDKMKARVFLDVKRLLIEKVTDKKQNDSNTTTDRITLDGLMSNLNL